MSNHIAENGFIASTVEKFLQHRWLSEQESGGKATACSTLGRASSVYSCERQMAFGMAGVTPLDVPYLSNLIALDIGNEMHIRVQSALHDAFPDFESEVPIDLTPLGYDVSGSADGLLTIADQKIIVEIKTSAGYPFRICAEGNAKSNELAGPKIEHLIQAGIYAHGVGADGVLIIMINKENMLYGQFKVGQTLEFEQRLDDVVPPCGKYEGGQTLRELVLTELMRMQRVADQVEAGVIPPRQDPVEGVLGNPPTFMASRGYWRCRYCNFNSTCQLLPTEELDVEKSTQHVIQTWNPNTKKEVVNV